jgi:hypothetical protein
LVLVWGRGRGGGGQARGESKGRWLRGSRGYPEVGERVVHRVLDCRRSRDDIVNIGVTKSLMTSEWGRGVSIRALSDGDEGSTDSNYCSVQKP